ncbi:MAG: GNAT family N-acetyltransferase, partial [Candidatus Dormibacteraeota bacterium]|nr:GNAT family N-acetyltransferase [Candidatus Dormibacteraeota bacterium]
MTEVRHIDDASFTAWAALVLDAFGGDGQDPESLRQARDVVDQERSLGAFDGPLLVGTATSFIDRIRLPFGAEAPLAAVSGVAVAPTHRRRGILTRLMRQQLTELHEQGEPLAGLWASEAAIYPRFGYGLGTYVSHLRVRREQSAFRRPYPVEHVVQIDEEAARRIFPGLQARAANGHPGFILRSATHWEDAFYDPPARRHGAGRHRFVVHQDGTEPDGYAWYRTRRQRGASGENESVLQV